MRRGLDLDPEQDRRQNRAGELMLQVGLLVLADARRKGQFPTDKEELAKRLAQIEEHFDSGVQVILGSEWPEALPAAEYVVEVIEPGADRIGLTCRYGSHSVSANLRLDGVLEEEMAGVSIGFGNPEQAVPLSPEEEEVMRKASATFTEEREEGWPHFEGAEFVRALAVPPQPSAVVQILAVELFGDGFIVHSQYDDPVDVGPTIPLSFYERAGIDPPIEELLAKAKEEGGNLAPLITVTDDLGTVYRESGGGGGGVQTVRGADQFVPAVPAEARRLWISTYAGTVAVER